MSERMTEELARVWLLQEILSTPVNSARGSARATEVPGSLVGC